MTFKEEIDDADKRYWKDAREERMMDILEACVDKIDELESDLENLSGIVKGLHYRFGEYLSAPQNPPELIPGLSEDVLKDMVEIFKMNVAQKKRELEKEEQHD